MFRRFRHLLISALGLVGCFFALPAAASTFERVTLPFLNGSVNALDTNASGTVYFSGSFTRIGGTVSGNSAVFNSATATAAAPSPIVINGINTTVPDNAGGWYIGGSFTRVGSTSQQRLAHILANGTLDTSWLPTVDSDVNALFFDGSKVYVGGSFTTVNGQARVALAAIDTSGTLTAFDADISAGGYVGAIAASGTDIYFSGIFDSVGGQARTSIAAVNASGTPLAFAPTVSHAFFTNISTLTIFNGLVYFGGMFDSVNSTTRNYAAAVDSNGNLTAFNPDPDGTVSSMAHASGVHYLAGSFTNAGGQARSRLAAVDDSGSATAWDADLDGSGNFVTTSGTRVYVAGGFTTVDGVTRNGVAEIDSAGTVQPWNPNLDADGGLSKQAYTIMPQGTTIFTGGAFVSYAGHTRQGLAAINASGTLLDWAPVPNSDVTAIATSGTSIYLGGFFTDIDGQARERLAEVNQNGTLLPWNPGADGSINAIVPTGTSIYVGGSFSTAGGELRDDLAEINTSGSSTAWNPGTDGSVSTIAIKSGTVYVGGNFNLVGGENRNFAAAINGSGAILPWNPDPDSTVATILATTGTVYLGGQFNNVGGETRNHIAGVDPTSGALQSFYPELGMFDTVNSLVLLGNETIVIGGEFTSIGGETRKNVAAVDTTGSVQSLDVGPSGLGEAHSVTDLETYGNTLYIGGTYLYIDLYPTGGFSAYEMGPEQGSVTITGVVPASLAFSLRNSADTASANTCSLGTLSVSATSTCSYRLRIQTNASFGFTIVLVADHALSSNGSATLTQATDNQTSGAGSEAYGILTVDGATTGGRNNEGTAYDQAATVSNIAGTTFNTAISPVPTSTTQILSYGNTFVAPSAPSATGTTLVTHFATMSAGTPAGNYTQTVTYIATANF